MTSFSSSGSYGSLIKKLQKIATTVESAGVQWAIISAKDFEARLQHHLDEQGRSEPPPLSPATLKIYEVKGEPDGSALRDQLEIYYRQEGEAFVAGVGIPEGKPTMIAKVQNDGAIIGVTEKMRGFLSAAYGIHLKASTTQIVVPGRHFWDKAFKESKEDAKRRFAKMMLEIMV